MPRVSLGPRRNVTSSGSGIAASGGALGTGTLPGVWYTPAMPPAAAIPFNGVLQLSPFFLSRSASLTNLSIEVTVVGTAGSVVRAAIFADNGSAYPGALLFDSGLYTGGSFDGTSTGEKTFAFDGASGRPGPLSLPAGLYWTGGVNQGGPATSPTLRVNSGQASNVGSATALFALQNQLAAYYMSPVAGAVPATFDTTKNVTSSAPRVALKFA